jgi:hypothetical protein
LKRLFAGFRINAYSSFEFLAFVPLVVLTPVTAFADAGIPLIALTIPAMLVLIVPVTLVETLVYRHILKRKLSNCIVPVGLANLASTLIGIPLVCIYRFCGFLLGALIVHAARVESFFQSDFGVFISRLFSGMVILRPGEPISPIEGFFIFGVELAIAYLVSVWYELRTMKKLLATEDPDALKKAAWISNAFSYAFLILVVGAVIFLREPIRKALEKESRRHLVAFSGTGIGCVVLERANCNAG